MGVCASLFFSSDASAETLDRRIRPTDTQQDEQQERWGNLAEFLQEYLSDATGLSTKTWLQGSYKFATQIRPATTDGEFDIDLGFYFEWAGEPEDGEYDASALKSLIQSACEAYRTSHPEGVEQVAPPKPRCSRVHFAKQFHIDVPSYHLDKAQDIRHLATEKDGWEHSDPKAIYLWWKNSLSDDRLRAIARRVVRYMKMWSALKCAEGQRLSSIALTVLVANAVAGIDPASWPGDDEGLVEVAEAIVERLNKSYSIINPVDQSEDLNRLDERDTEAFANSLKNLVDVGSTALKATSVLESAEHWSEVFDHFFPLPDDDVYGQTASAGLPAIVFDPIVEIVAVARKTGQTWKGTNRIVGVPKDCDLTFILSNADRLPNGAIVRWVVRNTGREASSVNDLGHINGEGYAVEEHTSYKGTHSMDVSVKLDGRLIGRRRVPVTILGIDAVPRNPSKRPAFVTHRRRR